MFALCQPDRRIARDFGGKDVFAVFEYAFRITVPPMVVDFVNAAFMPVAKLSVRKADASFLPNLPPRSLLNTLALLYAAGYRLPEAGPVCPLDKQDMPLSVVQYHQRGHGILQRLRHQSSPAASIAGSDLVSLRACIPALIMAMLLGARLSFKMRTSRCG